MKPFSMLRVVLFLSFAELEAAKSVSQFSCLKRNLTVTVDDFLRIYIDGIEINGLPNADIYSQPDVVDLPCNARLIAIHGRNEAHPGGILASTDDEYVLTNTTWKCSNISHSGWEKIDFDDSAWMSPVEYGHNGDSFLSPFIPGISTNAAWIWLRQWNGQINSTLEEMDLDVYCRKRLDKNECLLGAPDNECDPSMGECIDFFGGYNCSCFGGYTNDGSKSCRDVNECLLSAPDNECDPSMGECMNVIGSYSCRCYEGYTNDGNKRCKDVNECLLGASDNECDPSMGECVNIFGGYNCSCFEGCTNNGSERCISNTSSSACQPVVCSSDDIAIAMSALFSVSLAVNITILITWLCKTFRAKKDPLQTPENVLPTEITDPSNVSSAPSPDEELGLPDESQVHQNNYEKLPPNISHKNDQQPRKQN